MGVADLRARSVVLCFLCQERSAKELSAGPRHAWQTVAFAKVFLRGETEVCAVCACRSCFPKTREGIGPKLSEVVGQLWFDTSYAHAVHRARAKVEACSRAAALV